MISRNTNKDISLKKCYDYSEQKAYLMFYIMSYKNMDEITILLKKCDRIFTRQTQLFMELITDFRDNGGAISSIKEQLEKIKKIKKEIAKQLE